MIEQAIARLWVLGPTGAAALVLSCGLILLLRPYLARYALARPNARSSHHLPTPQGGGIAVVAAALGVSWCALAFSPSFPADQVGSLLNVTLAATVLAIVGAFDDIHPLPVLSRLLVQCLVVGGLIAMLPNDLRTLPQHSWWLERACLVIAGVWFVNAVNFMDGIDWMSVAEFAPVAGALAVIGMFGWIGPVPAVVAAALLGAILGFAPFNRPVAKLFLGDVGSLPLGLLLGWLLLELAAKGHAAAAIILPLYYLADATATLVRRIATGEPFWRPHRTHFYQRATDRGFSVPEIINRVFAVNLALAALALVTVAASTLLVSAAALVAAAVLVAGLLLTFVRGKR
jgi:UDP-N-acetylmuramyl pentapeptide phosphotransferase/UDP-N-acetylglucosamine-1-phosphate transferase